MLPAVSTTTNTAAATINTNATAYQPTLPFLCDTYTFPLDYLKGPVLLSIAARQYRRSYQLCD